MVRARWWFPLVILLLAAPVMDAHAQTVPPPTLTGEYTVGMVTFTGPCDPRQTSTIRYTSFGLALGPYPGTYTEIGTFTLGPQNGTDESGTPLGDVKAWEAG